MKSLDRFVTESIRPDTLYAVLIAQALVQHFLNDVLMACAINTSYKKGRTRSDSLLVTHS